MKTMCGFKFHSECDESNANLKQIIAPAPPGGEDAAVHGPGAEVPTWDTPADEQVRERLRVLLSRLTEPTHTVNIIMMM